MTYDEILALIRKFTVDMTYLHGQDFMLGYYEAVIADLIYSHGVDGSAQSLLRAMLRKEKQTNTAPSVETKDMINET